MIYPDSTVAAMAVDVSTASAAVSNTLSESAPQGTVPVPASVQISAADMAVLRSMQREEYRLSKKTAQHGHEDWSARHAGRAASLTRVILVVRSLIRNE